MHMVVEVDKLMRSEDAVATELLERARRLCLAVRQFELPVVLPGLRRDGIEREESERADEAEGDSGRTRPSSSKRSQLSSMEKLPPITGLSTATTTKKHKKPANQKKKLLEEARRLGGEEKNKKNRELEKVKQAQERARARVTRTNQMEQQQTQRTAAQRQFTSWSAEECIEKVVNAQESRRRARERIRMKRQETADITKPNAAPVMGAELDKLKSFHRKTIRRLQASTQQAIQSSEIERADTPERRENIDADQKLMERKVRQETTARLRRMKQLVDNQKRQEQQEFDQGLQKYKSKLRELDRVAKGLSKQAPLPETNEPTTFELEEPREEIVPPLPNARYPGPVQDELMSATDQDGESSLDSDAPNNAPSPVSHPDRIGVSSPGTADSNTRHPKMRCKLPVWKRPPVPIRPMQCYSFKALLPMYSRVLLPSKTRFRAHGS
ncbi:hypothetical protein PC121_g3936 [Phytophthora cactorum]|nr:hypothetical protein PC120_g1900 [Phytophthora cactorum]KAG3091011.1 hypothetical protein PC121_g3936 [Phytophthora cactorum]KAG4062798.1 hypothetical protein PC123_g2383 [Phytophthora cactorum]